MIWFAFVSCSRQSVRKCIPCGYCVLPSSFQSGTMASIPSVPAGKPGKVLLILYQGYGEKKGKAVCHNEQSASLLWFRRKQAAPRPNSNLSVWFGSRFALFFESRTQYAPSFSLSAPCILLTLTHRLRFISNPYFDTPSFLLDGPRPPPASSLRNYRRRTFFTKSLSPCWMQTM